MQGHFPVPTWTDEAVTKLTELWASGVSAALISVEIGKTRNAVIGKVARLGLPMRATVHAEKSGRKPAPKRERKPRPPSPETVARLALIAARQGAVPVEDMTIPHEQRKTLLELTPTCCRWPVGDPCIEGFYFCGGVAEKDGPFCPSHARRAYA